MAIGGTKEPPTSEPAHEWPDISAKLCFKFEKIAAKLCLKLKKNIGSNLHFQPSYLASSVLANHEELCSATLPTHISNCVSKH